MAKELLVPRKGIYFTPLEGGKFVPIASDVPDALQQPLVRTPSGSIKGYESGYRSGLLTVDKELYKIKGCRPEGKVYHDGNPSGSQTYSLAQFEAERTLERREAFIKKGIDYPIKPIGFWVYEKILHEGEPNAATIYRAKGDTRLDEFLWFLEKIPLGHVPEEYRERLYGLLERSGHMVGQMLRILHNNNFSWDTDTEGDGSNAHSGNVIIFPERGRARFGIVDFDNSNNYHPEEDSEEDVKAMQAFQKADLSNLKSDTEERHVQSGPNYRKSNPYLVPYTLVNRILRRIAVGVPKDDLETAGDYLMKIIRQDGGKIGQPRQRFTKSLEQGYRDDEPTDSDVVWEELLRIRRDVARFRKQFSETAKTKLGGYLDKDKISDIARKYRPFQGYELPVVVDIAEFALLENENEETARNGGLGEERKIEVTELAGRMIRLHAAYLSQHPSTGENYFSFPILSQDVLKEHSRMSASDIADLVTLWVSGNLRDDLIQEGSPRAIGSFILTLAQTVPNRIAEGLLENAPTKDDPRLMDKLIHMEELFLPLLNGAVSDRKKVEDLRLYVDKLIEKRSESFCIEKEAEKKAGISLFGYGIITNPLYEIFNHMLFSIVVSDFDTNQLMALEALMERPKVLDKWGPNPANLLKLAITSIQVRNGQTENLAFIQGEEVGDYKTTLMKYLFSSVDRNEINDGELKNALEVPSAGWLDWAVRLALLAKKPIHPNSYLAHALKETICKTDDLVDLLKTALDVNKGDFSRIDPVVTSFFETGHFEGAISKEKASDLIQACIGFGVELPEVLEPYFTDENIPAFMGLLAKDPVIKEGNIYGHIQEYPTHPIHALLSRGAQALPERIRNLFLEKETDQATINVIATSLLDHLYRQYSGGYFRNYFGTMYNIGGNPEYPKPAFTLGDIYKAGRQMWRIVHSDIWNILNLADAQVLKDFFEKNVKYGIIEMETRNQASGMVGYRKTPLVECLPPNLYEKVISPEK